MLFPLFRIHTCGYRALNIMCAARVETQREKGRRFFLYLSIRQYAANQIYSISNNGKFLKKHCSMDPLSIPERSHAFLSECESTLIEGTTCFSFLMEVEKIIFLPVATPFWSINVPIKINFSAASQQNFAVPSQSKRDIFKITEILWAQRILFQKWLGEANWCKVSRQKLFSRLRS